MHPHGFLFDGGDFSGAKVGPGGGEAWVDDRIEVHVVAENGHAVVTVAGEIDPATAGQFWRGIESALTQSDRLIIDLRDTSFIDSTGIEVLIKAYQRVGQIPEALVVQPSDTAHRVLTVTGLDRIFDIDGTDR